MERGQGGDETGYGLDRAVAARPRPLRSGLPSAAIGAAIVLACAALAGFAGFVASLQEVEHEPEARADGIVALTGGAQRIGDAIDLLAKGFAARLLITGVNERTTRDEIARLSPGQRRLVECCVDLDYRARNTIGNAAETRRWVRSNGFSSLIVVTSNYHMPRTLTELEHVLPRMPKTPYPVVTAAFHPSAWWSSPAQAKLLAAEYTKYVAALVRTRIVRCDPEWRSAGLSTTSPDAEPMR